MYKEQVICWFLRQGSCKLRSCGLILRCAVGGAVINTEKQSILLREFYRIGLNRGVRLGALP